MNLEEHNSYVMCTYISTFDNQLLYMASIIIGTRFLSSYCCCFYLQGPITHYTPCSLTLKTLYLMLRLLNGLMGTLAAILCALGM